MQNVAMMTARQVNGILSQLEMLGATIKRGQLVLSATAPSGKQVLSAALIKTRHSEMWHVRAAPGLIEAR